MVGEEVQTDIKGICLCDARKLRNFLTIEIKNITKHIYIYYLLNKSRPRETA